MNAETNAGGNTKTNTETNTGTNADLDRADTNSFYGDRLSAMQATAEQLTKIIESYPGNTRPGNQSDNKYHPVLYCTSRIKSPESMKNKLKKHGYPLTCESALTNVRDAIGIRAICSFSDDVFALARWLCERPEFNVINQKDYISYPKPNGYRSYHLIFQLVDGPGDGLFAEIQLQTIAIDFWASLEHQLKYKHEITHEALIRSELKRCADEIASIDLSMQTIRDLIDDNFSNCSERSSSP